MSSSSHANDDDDPTLETDLLLNRFTSASSATDVGHSLDLLHQGIQSGRVHPDEVVADPDALAGLRLVLQGGSETQWTGVDRVPAARLLLAMLKYNGSSNSSSNSNKPATMATNNRNHVSYVLLHEPQPGQLLETLIDVAAAESNNNNEVAANASSSIIPPYPRVVCLQILEALCVAQPRAAQSQLLAAPAGLHRLGDLLRPDNMNNNSNSSNTADDDVVRHQALATAHILAQWPAVSKVWMFSEVGDAVWETALRHGGLTYGNSAVLECVTLLQRMLSHDAALATLVLESPVTATALTTLLDLRGGANFLHPPAATIAAVDESDDLDDLLSSKKETATAAAPVLPLLLPAEEAVVHAVLDIFATVLENETVKLAVWSKMPALASLVWEMALLTPPPRRDMPFPCAVPSLALQQRALEIVAQYFHSPDLLQRHAGLDRLLYLVCTGGRGIKRSDKMGISQAALHALRRTVPDAVLNEMLLVTLAPSMDDDGVDGTTNAPPPAPRVVEKLLNTAFDNLRTPEPTATDTAASPSSSSSSPVVARQVFLAGSLSALSLFLTDEPRRSILVRVAPTLLEAVVQCVLVETNVINSDDGNNVSKKDNDDDFVACHLLRFLCLAVQDAPVVVSSLLTNPVSLSLSSVLSAPSASTNVMALCGTLLGLCMQHMPQRSSAVTTNDDDSPNNHTMADDDCGGWTSDTILSLVSKRGGIQAYTAQLEALKHVDDTSLPWSVCRLEYKVWADWYARVVLGIRKRVVQQVTGGGATGGGAEQGSADRNEVGASGPELALVAEQASELEALRTSLTDAQRQIESQDKQLATWKQRAESTPTQLDEMLNDVTKSNLQQEQEIQSLKDELAAAKETHESELQQRDDTIASVRNELSEANASVQEARQERDTLRDDMTALSHAYSSLEEEYRRQQSEAAAPVVVPETPAGDDQGSEQPHQPQGEESHQSPHAPGGSTTVSTLRAENARMRNDAQEADAWMAMAVDRMNVMGTEAAALQNQIQLLKSQLDEVTSSAMTAGDETGQRLAQETEHRMRLEQELTQSIHQLKEESNRRDQLEIQFNSCREEAETVADRLKNAVEQHESLEKELISVTEQIRSTQATENGVMLEGTSGMVPSLSGLCTEIQGLQQTLANTRSGFETLRHQSQEEIDHQNARIRTLEASATSTDDTAAPHCDIALKNEEIEQLTQANADAQAWMAKAVEHHEALAGEVAALTEKNQTLSTEVAAVKASSNALESLNFELENSKKTIERLKNEADSRNAELQSSRSPDVLQGLETEIDQRQALLDTLKAEAMVKDEEIELLRGKLVSANLVDEFVDRSTELDELRAAISERDRSISMLQAQVENLQSSKHDLLQKIADMEALRIEFGGTTEEEIELLRARAAEAELRNSSIEKILEAVGKEKAALADEAEKNRDALDKIEIELNELKAAGDADITHSTSNIEDNFDELQLKIENLELQLADSREEASGVIQQWEETYTTLQNDHLEVEKQLQSSLHEKDQLQMQIVEERKKIETLQDELGALTISDQEKDRLLARISELEVLVQNLKGRMTDQDQDASEVVEQWQESYNEIELQLKSMAVEKEDLLLQLNTYKEQLAIQADKSSAENDQSTLDGDEAAGLRFQISELENQMKDQEEDANAVVLQWQDSYQALEDQLETVTAERNALSKTLDEQKVTGGTSSSPPTNTSHAGENSEPGGKVSSLEKQLAVQIEEASAVVAKWQKSYEEVASELDAVSQELEVTQAILQENQSKSEVSSDGALVELKQTVASLSQDLEAAKLEAEASENKALNIQEMLADQEQESSASLSQWQASYEDVAEQLSMVQGKVSQLEEELSKTQSHLAQCEAAKKNSDDTQEEMNTRIDETQNKVEHWRKSHADISAQLDATLLELEGSKATVATLDEELETLRARDTSSAANVRQLEDELSLLRAQLEEQEDTAGSIVSQWQDSYNEIAEELAGAVSEKESLQLQVHQHKSTIDSLEAAIEARAKEVDSTIEQWQESHANIAAKLETAESDLHESRQALATANSAIGGEMAHMEDSKLEVLEDQVTRLQLQLKEQENVAEGVLSQWKESYDAVADQMSVAAEEKNSLQVKLSRLEIEAQALSSISELEADVQKSKNELASSECRNSELSDEIEQLHKDLIQSKQMLHEVNEKVRNSSDLNDRDEHVSSSHESNDGFEIVENTTEQLCPPVESSEARVVALEATIRDLQNDLKDHMVEAEGIVQQWKQSYDTVVAELENCRQELRDSKDTLARAQSLSSELNHKGKDSNKVYDDRISELESELVDLKSQLTAEGEGAIYVVSQWKDSHATLTTQLEAAVRENSEVRYELNNVQNDLDETRSKLEEALSATICDEATEASERIADLERKLDRSNQEHAGSAKLIEGLHKEVEARKTQSEKLQQMLSRENESDMQQESKISSLENRVNDHLEAIHRLEREVEQKQQHVNILKQQMMESTESFNSQLESARSESSRMHEFMDSERQMERGKLSAMEHAFDSLKAEKEDLFQEISGLRLRIVERENELLEANEALQLCYTNDLSDKASDMIANVLRDQIEDMRSRAHEDQSKLSDEREQRKNAEAEIERLRTDLAALLGMEDNEENRSAIQQRMMEATETFQRKERNEIEEIKQALSRALEELATVRKSEKEVEEVAAKAKHQAILYEQEVVNAKGDFKFLSQTMDEMREAESIRRTALEYRISSLENEKCVAQRFHSAEVQSVKNELSQVNMERDRLFEALKESEKNKAALLHASSQDLQVGGNTDAYAELARLRIEKSQLLSAASDEASRIERRIRETRAASKASADADILLEKELRLKAQSSLESIKLEMDNLKLQIQKTSLEPNKENNQLDEQGKLSDIEKDYESLQAEHTSLQDEFDQLKKDFNLRLERLTEEYRQAKARASDIERDGRYEAEVRVEVARLQASHSNSMVIPKQSISQGTDRDDSMTVSKLYDIIQQQKRAIDEERNMYIKIADDNENLCAFVAQQELYKDILKESLDRYAGQDAVDETMARAEAQAKEQYGTCVKLEGETPLR